MEGGHVIDFRSDTLTSPNLEMKQSVLEAPLGDDVYGEDPTVNALQDDVAKLLGKEAALFVPTGTMGNLICVMNHCWGRGCEVIFGDRSHTCLYEQGGIATLGGVHTRSLKNLPDGTFSIEDMKSIIRAHDIHFPITSLVCIENTHNMMGGKVLPLSWLDEISEVCRDKQIPIHLDGARLLNAAVFLNIPVSRLVRDVSSVCICLSKGLGAPVGSVIAGSKEFIVRARRLRKALGGGMRQAGVLASMGRIAIRDYKETLKRDHENLQKIAKAVDSIASSIIQVDTEATHTNILLFKCDVTRIKPDQFCRRVLQVTEQEQENLNESLHMKLMTVSKSDVRLVMHRDITDEYVDLAIKKLTYVIEELENN